MDVTQLLSFIATQKDMLFFQISVRREEIVRITTQAAVQQQLIEGAYAQIMAYDKFESACTNSIQSRGIDIESVRPLSYFDQSVSIGSFIPSITTFADSPLQSISCVPSIS